MPLPLNWVTASSVPQNVHESVILRNTMFPPSTEMNR